MKLYPLAFFLILLGSLSAQPAVVLEPLPMTFTAPTDLVGSPEDPNALYVVEKAGLVNRFDLVDSTAAIVLDLRSRVDTESEGGLLGMAFHPQYPDSNYVYVNYTGPGQGGAALTTYISRFPLDNAGIGIDLEERILLTIDQPAANHNAGDLAFGPDGYLYIPTGDGGRADDVFRNAQDPGTLLGNLLRIDVDTTTEDRAYGIPADNPFVGAADTLDEIWALGLRNPWRISFDRETGDLWIGDVGQGAREEVNYVAAGSPGGMNFGWNCREGLIAGPASDVRCSDELDRYTDPVLDYPHSGNGEINGKSITGGFVYRGPAQDLVGYYVFADFVSPRLFLYGSSDSIEDPVLSVQTDLPVASASTFGEGADGALYLADFTGTLYRVTTETATPVRGAGLTGTFSVFPNPASRRINVEVDNITDGNVRAELISADGRTIARWEEVLLEKGRARLDLPAAPHGTYVLLLQREGRRWTSRIGIE